jgi:hypothetical protein
LLETALVEYNLAENKGATRPVLVERSGAILEFVITDQENKEAQ